jgi:D-aminopeptidase
MSRMRLRELGITIGRLPTGPHNAITDVPGVWVGHTTLVQDQPRTLRTGVTMVVPREGEIWRDHAFAGSHVFNGNGEMTGLPWLEESGLLTTPIGITNTHSLGVVRDALVAYAAKHGYLHDFLLPVVAETYDGRLNDINAFAITAQHAFEALAAARRGPVPEGSVGGGTGMICHGFKAGIGTASRVVDGDSGRFTVGALVQANYGAKEALRVDGVPVGWELTQQCAERIGCSDTEYAIRNTPAAQGSIIVILATDAPLLPGQCRRLARRATVGLARAGGVGYNGSGDLFLAFATGNSVPVHPTGPLALRMLPHAHLNPFFDAVAEAVEEAILNSLTAADTMTGFGGFTAPALPLDELLAVMQKYRPAA